MQRILWIDAVKGLAIVLVILVHATQPISSLPKGLHQAFAFGAMGVQLFFFMSAYSTCASLSRLKYPLSIKSYCQWIGRKYWRLFPWYGVGMVLYLSWFSIVADQTKLANYTLSNVVLNCFFLNGFSPLAQNSIVPGGWSISCIAMFVFVAPLLWAVKLHCRAGILLGMSAAGIIIAMMGYSFWGWSRFFSYCIPLNQIVVFGIGMMYWELREKLPTAKRWGGYYVIGTLVFFLAAVLAVVLDREHAIFYRQALCALSFCSMLPLFEAANERMPQVLTWLGRHSYEIFILHFLVIWLVVQIVERANIV